jgi:hypothetical protein
VAVHALGREEGPQRGPANAKADSREEAPLEKREVQRLEEEAALVQVGGPGLQELEHLRPGRLAP